MNITRISVNWTAKDFVEPSSYLPWEWPQFETLTKTFSLKVILTGLNFPQSFFSDCAIDNSLPVRWFLVKQRYDFIAVDQEMEIWQENDFKPVVCGIRQSITCKNASILSATSIREERVLSVCSLLPQNAFADRKEVAHRSMTHFWWRHLPKKGTEAQKCDDEFLIRGGSCRDGSESHTVPHFGTFLKSTDTRL